MPSFEPSALTSYLQIILINVVLSGDNVVVIGMAAAGLAQRQRGKAIMAGIGVATLIRIAFSVIAVRLLAITGLLFAGGLLLLWVCWKMYEELRQPEAVDIKGDAACAGQKSFGRAVSQIIVADVSMSLDNVLAVAGAARQDMAALVFGLILSVVLMGVAAAQVAKLLARHRWIGWIGLGIITYVALSMIYNGALEVLHR